MAIDFQHDPWISTGLFDVFLTLYCVMQLFCIFMRSSCVSGLIFIASNYSHLARYAAARIAAFPSGNDLAISSIISKAASICSGVMFMVFLLLC